MPTLSSKSKPKISVIDEQGNEIVFIEVLSDTMAKTVRKLYLILLLQLVYCSSNKLTMQVNGFVLPKRLPKGYIVLATVIRNAKLFKFVGTLAPISRDNFTDCFKRIVRLQMCCTDVPLKSEVFIRFFVSI